MKVSSGSKGALGGVATELGVVAEMNRILKLPVDPVVHEKRIKVSEKIGDDFWYRSEQSFSIAIGVMCWMQTNYYTEKVKQIVWTGPKGTFSKFGICEKHPADLLILFESGNKIGVSIKSSTTNGSKLNFRNRGISSLCNDMGCNFVSKKAQLSEERFLQIYHCSTRKELLIKQKNDINVLRSSKEYGTKILQQVRWDLLNFFSCCSIEENKQKLLDCFLKFTNDDLTYIKVTGLKTKAPIIENPLDNRVINLLKNCNNLTFESSGKYVIKVKADNENIIDLSPKYSNQKISTGIIVIAR